MKNSLITLFLLILNSFIFASIVLARPPKFEIRWNQSTLKVEVNSNLEEETKKIKPSLYVNGVCKMDADFTIIKNGQHELMGIEDIDITKPGTSVIYFKAIENIYKPGECFGYKIPVTIIVDDTTPPTVKEKIKKEVELFFKDGTEDGEIEKYLKSEEFYKSIYDYRDNLTAVKNIKVKIAIEKLGAIFEEQRSGSKFNVKTTFEDEKGNISETKEIIVKSFKGEKLTAVVKNNLIKIPSEEINAKIDLRKYIEIFKPGTDLGAELNRIYASGEIKDSDNKTIDLKELKTNKKFNEEIPIKVKFTYPAEFEVETRMIIISDYTPRLELKEKDNTLTIKVGNIINESVLKEYIKVAEYVDGSDAYDDVEVDMSNVDNKKVGEYMAILRLKEDFLNNEQITTKVKTVEIRVIVLAEEPPIITTEVINLRVGEISDLKEKIKVDDKTDNKVKIEIDESKINYNEEGTYFATAIATNSSNLKTARVITINITKDGSSDVGSFFAQYKIPLIVGGVAMIGGISYLTYHLIKKTKKKKKEIKER